MTEMADVVIRSRYQARANELHSILINSHGQVPLDHSSQRKKFCFFRFAKIVSYIKYSIVL